MADPFYSLNMPSTSNTHKRSYDDIAPDLGAGGPASSGSRREPIDSSDDAAPSRERNKRPRNENNDSSYTSEVDEILLSSNTSVSSSSSGSSLSSYHSARTTITAASPTLLEADEELDDDLSDPAVGSLEPHNAESSLPTLDVSMEDALSFVSRPLQASSPAPTRPVDPTDSETQFRRTMERVDAFDREMSALRQSPFRPPSSAAWTSWNDSSFVPRFASSSLPQLPEPSPAILEEPPASSSHFVHRALHGTDRLQPMSSSMLPDDPLPYPPRVNLPRTSGENTRSRLLSQFERDAARYGDTVGRGRAREDFFERFLGEQPSRSSPLDSFSTSSDSTRRTASRVTRAFAPFAPRTPDTTSNSRYFGGLPDLHSFVDDYWLRENHRQLEGFDRTIREAEAHRQSTVNFLAEAETLQSAIPRRDIAASSVSSGYSTLRGALDDSAVRRRSLNSRPVPTSSAFTRPIGDRFTHRRSPFDPDERVRSIGEASGFGDVLVHEDDEPTPYPRNFGFPSIRSSASQPSRQLQPPRPQPPRQPQPPHPSTDFSMPFDTYTTSTPTYDPTPSYPFPESYLERNSRARSSSISGLRRRARARSVSPPSPPPPPSTVEPFPLWDDADPFLHLRPSLSSITGPSRTLDSMRRLRHRVLREASSLLPTPLPRVPSADPLDCVNLEPSRWGNAGGSSMNSEPSRRSWHRGPVEAFHAIPPPSDSSPNPVDERPQPPPPLPSTTSRARSIRTIDLDAFREGPFRATLARSVAYTRETRQHSLVSAERERPARRQHARSVFSDSSEEDDEPSRYLSLFHQEPRSARRDLANPSSQLRTSNPGDRAPTVGTRRLDDLEDPYRNNRGQGASGWSSLVAAAHSMVDSAERSSMAGTSEHDLDMQRPVDRLRDLVSRPSASPSAAPSVAPPTAHRTLLSRERSLSSLRGYHDEPFGTARTSGLERWEQRRQLLQRFPPRARGGDSTVSSTQPTTTAAISSRESHRDEITPGLQTSRPAEISSRRYARPSHIPPRSNPPGGRAEGPLNGRFARRSFAPDMVWVDLPSTHRLPLLRRRRHLGDYMRDEDIDMSYEGLLSLSSLMGDVKPRGTPAEVISSLPKGTYGEWVRPGETEERCPICLDDYAEADTCMRIPSCSHWFHDGCLQQWLKGARTCPVCRGRVNRNRPAEESSAPVAGPSGSSNNDRSNQSDQREDEEDDSDRDGDRTPRHWSAYQPPWRHL